MTYETAAERARRLMKEVGDSDKSSFSKGDLRNILNQIAIAGECADATEVERIKRGDVFVARAIGGKARNWIALSCNAGLVVAVGMSSGDSAPNMTPCKCRYWKGRWIGSVITVFNESDVRCVVVRPYTDKAHLREVEQRLSELFKLPERARKRRRKQPLRVAA